MEDDHPFKLNIAIPNGIILTVLGILVALTPLVHDMIRPHALIDWLAGLLLIGGGGSSLYFGIRNMNK
ncbi:hypothetical protein LLG96_03275 [bacterium]|nr:hypothetical protein [bacterium]